jgi:hypothetical protein
VYADGSSRSRLALLMQPHEIAVLQIRVADLRSFVLRLPTIRQMGADQVGLWHARGQNHSDDRRKAEVSEARYQCSG